MIGIPPENTPEYVSFLVSFWAALYSGFIYSLFTGITVGLVVWGLQIKAEHRAQNQKFEDDLQILKENLKRVNFDDAIINIINAKRSIPQSVTEIIRLIGEKPVEEWGKKLKKNNDFIKKLSEFKKQKLEFDKLAGQLDDQLGQLIRSYNDRKSVDFVNDSSNVSYFIGRLYGYQYNTMKKWLISGDEQTLEESRLEVLTHPTLSLKAESYLAARNKLVEIVKEIKQMIIES